MSTYAEKKNEFRKLRLELDKNADTYCQAMEQNRKEYNEAKAANDIETMVAIRQKEEDIKTTYRKRDDELNEWLKVFKQEVDSKTLDSIIKDLNQEEDIERDILRELDAQGDFIVPNQTAFDKYAPSALMGAIYNLIEKGVLKKRDCEGTAYEYNR